MVLKEAPETRDPKDPPDQRDLLVLRDHQDQTDSMAGTVTPARLDLKDLL